jgi:PAS domain S-box-containing protein
LPDADPRRRIRGRDACPLRVVAVGHPVNLPALISTAAGGITLFVGCWHLLVFYRGAGERKQLAFALTCLAIAGFDFCSVGGYLTESVAWSAFWQRGEQVTGALLGVPFVWFLVLTTRAKLRGFAYVVSTYFAVATSILALAPHSWLFSDRLRITHVALPWGLDVTYHEVHHGPVLAALSGLSAVVILAVVGVALLKFPRATAAERRQTRRVQVGITTFLLGALNDIAVSRQLYPAPYLMEVAYLGLVLIVTWGMSSAVLELASTRAELRREHRRLQRIFENVNEIYVETTLDGTIREISASVYRVTRHPPDLRGRSVLCLYADARQRDELLRQLELHGRVSNFGLRLRIDDDETRDGEINAVLTRDEETGEPLVHGSLRDVTERRRAATEKAELERQLQRTQKLESLGVLAGGIAHDFNNILSAILGSMELVKLKLGAGHPLEEVLELGLSSGRRAAELSRLMLAYSGKGAFAIERLDLSTFVRGMQELLAVSVTRRIRIEYALATEPLVVAGDPSQLSQVLLNLVINAAEAIDKGSGRVLVTTRALDCSAEALRSEHLPDAVEPGRYVALEVHDDGVGMDAVTQQRLFDPFFTTKFSGRGLGLSAVLGIVRAHHGTIQVESEVGRGSTLRVLLPLAPGEEALVDAPPSSRHADWMGSGEALLVDDETAVLEVAAQQLSLLGFRVTASTSPADALATFRREPQRFLVAVLDMTMPELTGDDVLRQLRELRPDLPAVLVSGYSEETLFERVGRAARTRFIQKPFTVESLRAALQGLLSAQAREP